MQSSYVAGRELKQLCLSLEIFSKEHIVKGWSRKAGSIITSLQDNNLSSKVTAPAPKEIIFYENVAKKDTISKDINSINLPTESKFYKCFCLLTCSHLNRTLIS